MAPPMIVTDEQLRQARANVIAKGLPVKAPSIKNELIAMGLPSPDESTIRGRFIQMNEPLSSIANVIHEAEPVRLKMGAVETAKKAEAAVPPQAVEQAVSSDKHEYPPELKAYIPTAKDVEAYIERDTDARLAIHYKLNKHPITQGKQGTGKTFSHLYYAYKMQVPFMLISCFEDLVLHKFFGDKTIKDGSIVFREGILTQMIQHPCVILFDEINAVSNAKSFDFHALLQNRELFVKDANDGKGKTYKLHPDCRIGFAQNPRSAKYVGGVTKPSSFLGRCTYITFPDFTKDEVAGILMKKFPKLDKKQAKNFSTLFFEANHYLLTNGVNVDISIRQIINVAEFYVNGMPLKDAIHDGLIDVLDSISDPGKKEGLKTVSKAIFPEIATDNATDNISKLKADIIKSAQAQFVAGTTVTAVASTTP